MVVVGGLTDALCPGGARAEFQRRILNVSREVAASKASDLTSMGSGWRHLADMPNARTEFSTLMVDGTVCVVGDGFCDLYDVESNTWSSVSDVPKGLGPRPALAAVGSSIFVFGSRPSEGDANVFRRLDLCSRRWTPVPPIRPRRRLDIATGEWRSIEGAAQPPLRQDVTAAFAHNNLVYLVGWQAAYDHFIHAFDPLEQEWELVAQNIRGRIRGPGVLVRRQKVDPAVFFGNKEIKCVVPPL